MDLEEFKTSRTVEKQKMGKEEKGSEMGEKEDGGIGHCLQDL